MIGLVASLIVGLSSGLSLTAILGGVSAATWVEIAISALAATPQAQDALAKLHPSFDQLVVLLRQHTPAVDAGHQVHRAFSAISAEEAAVELRSYQ